MRIGDPIRVGRGCRLLGEVAAVQRSNAGAGLCFSRVDLADDRGALLVHHPDRAPLHLDVEYGISRTDLRTLRRIFQLRASAVPTLARRPEDRQLPGGQHRPVHHP